MRVVDDQDKVWEEVREEMIASSLSWWRQGVDRPECRYLIWSRNWTDETKAKWKPIYDYLIGLVDREKVSERTRKSWGRELFKNLSAAGYVEQPPSLPDHRDVIEWVRVNCPLCLLPDANEHKYLTVVEIYLKYHEENGRKNIGKSD